MPNHVTHRVVVVGPAAAIAAFRSAFLVTRTDKNWKGEEETYTALEFNSIVPMPKELEGIESSSFNDTALLLVGRADILNGERYTPISLSDMLSWPWVQNRGDIQTVEQLSAYLKQQHPEWETLAQKLIAAYEATGYTNWYPWCCANWGTKWNAYSFRIIDDTDERFEFTFNTAWSTPEPIWTALAKREEMKDLELTFTAFDEGWNFAARGKIVDQVLDLEGVPATAELYETVYGEACEINENAAAE